MSNHEPLADEPDGSGPDPWYRTVSAILMSLLDPEGRMTDDDLSRRTGAAEETTDE